MAGSTPLRALIASFAAIAKLRPARANARIYADVFLRDGKYKTVDYYFWRLSLRARGVLEHPKPPP